MDTPKPLLLKWNLPLAYLVLEVYTGTRNYPHGKQKFDGLCKISPKVIVLQKSYIPHWKALILSFLEV